MNAPSHFQRLGTKSARQMKCQCRSTAKKKFNCFACVAFTFHPPVGNFAARGEMGLFFLRVDGGRYEIRTSQHTCQWQRGYDAMKPGAIALGAMKPLAVAALFQRVYM